MRRLVIECDWCGAEIAEIIAGQDPNLHIDAPHIETRKPGKTPVRHDVCLECLGRVLDLKESIVSVDARSVE